MARRSGRGKRRRKQGDDRALWFAGLGCTTIAVVISARFVMENPGWAIGIASVAIAAFGAGLFLRYRILQARRQRFLAANTELTKVDLMTGTQFEHLVAERLITEGFRRVRERGRSGDGGVDITAVAPGGTPYAIQCKRYGGSVGAPAVRNFLGALANAFNGHTGILITSGRLTDQARTEALNARQPLILLERDHLADWLIGQRTILTRPMRLAEADDPAT
ncbi:hypothetical protein GCM10022224_008730 [Nonomuraea antimicrobica]|uniref:Restriction endonuclease type IV Mrr domain-containing protein n=1 Tax=Nonomuraea antimicrobica TaxID=561173 RepID=A0ABP7B4Z5_9ACTN